MNKKIKKNLDDLKYNVRDQKSYSSPTHYSVTVAGVTLKANKSISTKQIANFKMNLIVIELLQKDRTIKYLCNKFKITPANLKETYFRKINEISHFSGADDARFKGARGEVYRVSIRDDLVTLNVLSWRKNNLKNEVQELHDNEYYQAAVLQALESRTKHGMKDEWFRKWHNRENIKFSELPKEKKSK